MFDVIISDTCFLVPFQSMLLHKPRQHLEITPFSSGMTQLCQSLETAKLALKEHKKNLFFNKNK